MLKLCTKCLREYPPTSEYFYKHPNTKDGLQSWCKSCSNESRGKWHEKNKKYMKKYQKENKEKIKNNQLKHSFGLTLDVYNQMLKKQNHRCGICERHESEFERSLAVHENPKTGEIRGLLCLNCNIGLGNFKHNPLLLIKATKYLQKY